VVSHCQTLRAQLFGVHHLHPGLLEGQTARYAYRNDIKTNFLHGLLAYLHFKIHNLLLTIHLHRHHFRCRLHIALSLTAMAFIALTPLDSHHILPMSCIFWILFQTRQHLRPILMLRRPVTGGPPWWSSFSLSLENIQKNYYAPFLNPSTFRLMNWFYNLQWYQYKIAFRSRQPC
jgi:hypothetical protein